MFAGHLAAHHGHRGLEEGTGNDCALLIVDVCNPDSFKAAVTRGAGTWGDPETEQITCDGQNDASMMDLPVAQNDGQEDAEDH